MSYVKYASLEENEANPMTFHYENRHTWRGRPERTETVGTSQSGYTTLRHPAWQQCTFCGVSMRMATHMGWINCTATAGENK